MPTVESAVTYDLSSFELSRLTALQKSGLLDSEPEPVLDYLTQTASELFDVPIVALSLIDKDRQWFKSRVGLSAKETPRSHAFCDVTIQTSDVFTVKDASADERFSRNPLVVGQPYIRAYVGVPVKGVSEAKYGALCLIDQKKRSFSHDEINILKELGAIAERVISMCERGVNPKHIEREIDSVLLGL